MKCSCGAVALWQVGLQGFCRVHKQQAWQAAAEAKQKQQSIAGLLALDHERRVRDVGELAVRRHRS